MLTKETLAENFRIQDCSNTRRGGFNIQIKYFGKWKKLFRGGDTMAQAQQAFPDYERQVEEMATWWSGTHEGLIEMLEAHEDTRASKRLLPILSGLN